MNDYLTNLSKKNKVSIYICLFVVCIISVGSNVPENSFSYGLDKLSPIGKYLNGKLPMTEPGGSTSWKVIPAFPNLTFDEPLVMTPAPGSDCMYLGTRDGIVYDFDNLPEVSQKHTFLNIKERVAAVYDGGFLGIAFHPDFGIKNTAHEKHFYVYYCAREVDAKYPTGRTKGFFNTWLRLSRFSVDENGIAMPNSELIMINLRLYNITHRGGGIFFGNDGYLYVPIGEQQQKNTSQSITDNLQGGMLRIDVNCEQQDHLPPTKKFPLKNGYPEEVSGVGYCIPPDNPFINNQKGHFAEYYAVGLRNPHRATIDKATGEVWIGEIGSSKSEEVNILQKGGNYGWPFREGDRLKGLKPLFGTYGKIVDPVTYVDHPEAQAVIGGYVYRGNANPELYGKYIFGDHISDRLYSVHYDRETKKYKRNYLCQFTPERLSTFGQDIGGEVYLCGLGKKTYIYKLFKGENAEKAPQKLSELDIFKDIASLEPIEGLIPYEVISPLYDDGAIQKRWMAIPNNGSANTRTEKIDFKEEKPWLFPKGSVFIKHLEMPLDQSDLTKTQRLETQLLVHAEDDTYYSLSYKWESDNSDAILSTISNDTLLMVSTRNGIINQTWHSASNIECMACHNKQAGYVLGVNTRQLNQAITYPASNRTANQLRTLNRLALFQPNIQHEAFDQFITAAALEDENASFALRARSYLDANCSNCHRPSTMNRAGFDARLTTPFRFQGYFHDNVIYHYDIDTPSIIKAGSIKNSALYLNMDRINDGRAMPPISKNKIHQEALTVIRTWIQGMNAQASSCLPSNLALNKSASQSSTYGEFTANLAIDGNTEGQSEENSITHTEKEKYPWWELDLGEVVDIFQINLWNRTDCCGERLANFYVLISEEPFISEDLEEVLGQKSIEKIYIKEPIDEFIDINVEHTGRYVRVQLDNTEILSLAEVEVLGCLISVNPELQEDILIGSNDAK